MQKVGLVGHFYNDLQKSLLSTAQGRLSKHNVREKVKQSQWQCYSRIFNYEENI